MDLKKIIFLLLFLLGIVLPGGRLSVWAQEASGGVGIFLDYDPPGSGQVTVYQVLYKSPADKAKVARGDRLLAVDGKQVTGKSLEEIASWIRGPQGSPVVLSLDRGGSLMTVTLTRVVMQPGKAAILPPPSQVGAVAGSGIVFSAQEKALVKQKILGLRTPEEQNRMMGLLKQLREGKLTKAVFLQTLTSEFP